MKTKYLIYCLLSLALNTSAFSQLSISRMFSDNMVLQRNATIPIFAKAAAYDTISVLLTDQNGIEEYSETVVNQFGAWLVVIKEHEAGGNYQLVINSSTEQIKLKNVTFGDIWLCGGQSNMEWAVERADNAEEEIANANYADIRLFTVPHRMAQWPEVDWETGHWDICSSSTISDFSAVGYFFGRNLQQELNVPIGLINNNWGGTVLQTWMSSDAYKGMPKYMDQIQELKTLDLEEKIATGDEAFNAWIATFQTEDEGINTNGENIDYRWSKLEDYSNWKEMLIPALWEESGNEALLEMNGVIWFQKNITLTEEQVARSAEWFFNPIDDTDKTWINGHLIGETYNQYNKDRHYIIEKNVLKVGDNSLVFRVEDYLGGGGAYGDTKKCYLQLGKEKIHLAGRWNYKTGYLATESMPRNAFGPNAYPTMLFNGMIMPMILIPIKGVIWYQGESNTWGSIEYRDLFQRFIKDWRKMFDAPKLPFIWVQLPNFTAVPETPDDSQWAELREAQALALELDNTAMIGTIDIGEADDIHPTNKQEVGRRLSLAALNEVYGREDVIYQGPVFEKAEIKENYVIIHFDPKDESLVVDDKYGYLKGFTISGENQVFHWAKAERIDEKRVKIWSDKVVNPKAVRYAWADNPQPANLYNKSGFPAFPFRTDDWKLSSKQ